jgi:hypothetical protein
LLVLLAMAQALPVHQEATVTLGESAEPEDPLSSAALTQDQLDEEAADAQSVEQQGTESSAATQEVETATSEINASSDESVMKANANDEMRRLIQEAGAKRHVLVMEATDAKNAADTEASQKYRTARIAIAAEEGRTKVDAYRKRHTAFVDAVKDWLARKDLARKREFEAYKAADMQLKVEINRAKTKRDADIQDTKKAAEDEELQIQRNEERSLNDIKRKVGEMKAQAAQDKAAALSATIAPDTTVLLQADPDEGLSMEAFEAQGDAEAAAEEAEQTVAQNDAAAEALEMVNRQKEAAASAKEESAFNSADETLETSRARADEQFAIATGDTDNKLAEEVSSTNAKFLKTKEIAERTSTDMKIKATSDKKATLVDADSQRVARMSKASEDAVAGFKLAEKDSANAMAHAKGTLESELALSQATFEAAVKKATDLKNHEVGNAAKAARDLKTQAAKEKQNMFEMNAMVSSAGSNTPAVALSSSLVLLSLEERTEPAPGDEVATSKSMTAEELQDSHKGESELDRAEANKAIEEIERNTEDIIAEKKAGDAQKAEQDAMNEAADDLKKDKANVDALYESKLQQAQDALLSAEEAAKREARLKIEQIKIQSNKDKVAATQAKDKAYNAATEAWELAKKNVRASELDGFKGIEEQQANKLKEAEDERVAAIAAAEADRSEKKHQATQAKASAFTAANTALAESKSAASSAKTTALTTLAGDRAAAEAALEPAIPV